MSANINGAAWTANNLAGSLQSGILYTQPGVYNILGSNVGAASFHSMAIQIANIAGPGTYTLGVGTTVRGGGVAISDGSGQWNTGVESGDAGTITISALTDSTITGTFSYVADAVGGTATGTKTVTGGDSHLKVVPTGEIDPLPDNLGSELSATIGGEFWNASFASGGVSETPAFLGITASNVTRQLDIAFWETPQVGTFPLQSVPTSRVIAVVNEVAPESNSWTSAGGSGTITFDSVTSTRVKGSFSATLVPTPLTQTTDTLTITNATFDVGLGPVGRGKRAREND
jgi:hypothetical protein